MNVAKGNATKIKIILMTYRRIMLSKLKPFQIYYTIFFLFGLNSFISFENVHRKRSKFLILSLRFIVISINSYIGYRECKAFEYTRYSHIFGYGVLIFVVVVNLVAVFENAYHLQVVFKILQELSAILKILDTYLNINYPYRAMKCLLNRKIAAYFVIIVVTTATKYAYEVYYNLESTMSIFWSISNAIKFIQLIHVVFYIDFMKCVLKSLSEKLAKKINDRQSYWFRGEKNEFLRLLCHIKSVYFKLWNVSQKMNTLFGWFLVVLMFESTTTAIYNVYWIFEIVRHSKNYELPRKYVFNLIIYF